MRGTINTNLFSPEANHFDKYGYYTDAIPGTPEFEAYWDIQKKYCTEGYSVGGVKITGYHYFYLNFSRIQLIPHEAQTKSQAVTKEERFPYFWDYDYDFFWAVEIAHMGITQPDYEKLGLSVTILHLGGGRHLVALKARGKGYSYKIGSMLARNMLLRRKSKNYAFAHIEDYLIGDGLLNKCWDAFGWNNTHCAWAQPLLVDQTMYKETGYVKNIRGNDTPQGTRNLVIGMSLKDDPDKVRGKRGDLLVFEEGGKFPELEAAWGIARPLMEQGKYVAGTMIAFGTGGSDNETDFESINNLFYEPDTYNTLPFDNQWDPEALGSQCGFFVPAYVTYEGYIDKDGNSDIPGATAYLEVEREKKKNSRSKRALDQFVAEFPFTPQEATMNATLSPFPVRELTAQLNSVLTKKRYLNGTRGLLTHSEHGIRFKPSDSVKALYRFPHSKEDDLSGAVVIYEVPHRGEAGQTPRHMYVLCLDPYAHDASQGKSLGAAYVLKMTNNFSHTFPDCIVASYVARPQSQDEFNRNVFMLARYYNADIGFENNVGNTVEYAKRTKQLDLLAEEFEIAYNKELQSSFTKRSYGMHMTQRRISQGIIYLNDWLLEPIHVAEDGENVLRLHTITDPALLQELIKYNDKGNFDRVSSLLVGMYHIKEKTVNSQAPRDKKLVTEFFNRRLFA